MILPLLSHSSRDEYLIILCLLIMYVEICIRGLLLLLGLTVPINMRPNEVKCVWGGKKICALCVI